MNNYPQCFIDELARYGQKPTYDLEWDRAILATMKKREAENIWPEITAIHNVVARTKKDRDKAREIFPDLSDPQIYDLHYRTLIFIADNIILAPQRRKFIVDSHNAETIRFLLLYFNESPLAEEVFPGRGYRLHKNIMLQGGVGVGKTLLMQIFAEYLRRMGNPRAFHNISVTQMVNHYTIHNNIDRYLYNEGESKGFQINPVNLCLNDVGVENRPFYGVDTLTIVNDFFHARNEIWANGDIDRKFAHVTTNLSTDRLKEKFSHKDQYGRIIDRFKTYNVIPLTGDSRR